MCQLFPKLLLSSRTCQFLPSLFLYFFQAEPEQRVIYSLIISYKQNQNNMSVFPLFLLSRAKKFKLLPCYFYQAKPEQCVTFSLISFKQNQKMCQFFPLLFLSSRTRTMCHFFQMISFKQNQKMCQFFPPIISVKQNQNNVSVFP